MEKMVSGAQDFFNKIKLLVNSIIILLLYFKFVIHIESKNPRFPAGSDFCVFPLFWIDFVKRGALCTPHESARCLSFSVWPSAA